MPRVVEPRSLIICALAGTGWVAAQAASRCSLPISLDVSGACIAKAQQDMQHVNNVFFDVSSMQDLQQIQTRTFTSLPAES